ASVRRKTGRGAPGISKGTAGGSVIVHDDPGDQTHAANGRAAAHTAARGSETARHDARRAHAPGNSRPYCVDYSAARTEARLENHRPAEDEQSAAEGVV